MNMGEKKHNKSANQYLTILAMGFIFCSAFLLFFAVDNHEAAEEGSADFSSLSGSKENALINKHLLKTTDDLEFQKMNAQLENLKAIKSLNETKPQKPVYSAEDNFFDFDGDPRLRQLAEDVGRANDVKSRKNNDPQNVVYESMFRDEEKQKNDYQTKVAQAKDFIAKAKKDGWAVVIDENFKIKSYKRINRSEADEQEEQEAKKFQGYELFPSK